MRINEAMGVTMDEQPDLGDLVSGRAKTLVRTVGYATPVKVL